MRTSKLVMGYFRDVKYNLNILPLVAGWKGFIKSTGKLPEGEL